MSNNAAPEIETLSKEQKLAFEIMMQSKMGLLADRVPGAGYANPVIFPSRHVELSMAREKDRESYGKLYSIFEMAANRTKVRMWEHMSPDQTPNALIGFSQVSQAETVLIMSLPLTTTHEDGRPSEIKYDLLIPSELAVSLREQLETGEVGPEIVYEIAKQFHAGYGPAHAAYSDHEYFSPHSLYVLPLALFPKSSKVGFDKDYDPNKVVKLIKPAFKGN